jgi:peptidyl-tRNA hydrolase
VTRGLLGTCPKLECGHRPEISNHCAAVVLTVAWEASILSVSVTTPASRSTLRLKICGRSSAVECFLAKEDVVSSTLTARSVYSRKATFNGEKQLGQLFRVPAPVISLMKRIKILVRRNLKLTKGKFGAQCVHAALGLLNPNAMMSVITLEKSDKKFEEAKLDHPDAYVVHDAGYTEVAPGTETCLAFYEDDPRGEDPNAEDNDIDEG